MQPISLEKFAERFVRENKGENKEQVIKNLKSASNRKENGATCVVCGQPIWAIGSAITGTDMCFSCTTGESDSSDDYEIDKVYHI